MAINLYYNLYTPRDPLRAAEIASCFGVLNRDPEIARVILLTESAENASSSRISYWQVPSRPTFQDFFNSVKVHSSGDDVNIIINSDCFIDPRTTRRLKKIKPGQAYCITRHELTSLVPLRVDKGKSPCRRYDMQDCWVVRGPLRDGMHLDFPMGILGCDNRFAHELEAVGYSILDPCLTIRVMHYHLSADRSAERDIRVPPPYAFPKKHGARAFIYEFAVKVSCSLRRRFARMRNVLRRQGSGEST